MQVDSLDALLEKLNSGDPAAAEQAFVAYEPYLRKVVRRLLPAELRRSSTRSTSCSRSTATCWRAFREGGMRFGTVAQLRAFLIRATRNRFIDRVRQHQTAARLEQPLGDDGAPSACRVAQPRPSESAAAEELWERLLALCPPEHHRLLRLRRRGATAREIAGAGRHARGERPPRPPRTVGPPGLRAPQRRRRPRHS